MESVYNLVHSERQMRLNDWLKNSCGFSNLDYKAMAYDASFRRYYRIEQNNQSYVLMDAPPPERCVPFVAIANALRAKGLHTPQIYHADLQNGFLLLSDFGDTTYLKFLDHKNVDQLYTHAMNALTVLQAVHDTGDYIVPRFTGDFMHQEWNWHKEWFLQKLLGISVREEEKNLNDSFDLLVKCATMQPQVFMHRDYHSANLMVLPDQSPGILDFQDAFIGPVTYDLVSLLRDCYIDWPDARVQSWVEYYWSQLSEAGVVKVGLNEFMRWFDWMGLERHLKALFTFARKKIRDDQAQYLKYIPRVLNYIVNVSARYPELEDLNHYFETRVLACVQ